GVSPGVDLRHVRLPLPRQCQLGGGGQAQAICHQGLLPQLPLPQCAASSAARWRSALKRRLIFFVAAILTALAGCNNRPSSGDRVLVAKFLYDTHLAEPDRFNVVVFKYPDKPLKNSVPTNYIKRLLGLP